MVSTITPATASQDLLEIAVRLVRLSDVINNLDTFDWCFFVLSLIFCCYFTFVFLCRYFTLPINQDNQINAIKFLFHFNVLR